MNESNSIYDAHAEYEKDVEQKKEEDDNQENFTFDEGSVKLTTVKESLWNGATGQIAECPCCGHVFHEKDEADYECPDCGEFLDFDDLNWHPDGDEYQDGEDNRVVIDPLEQMSESTNLKEDAPISMNADEVCSDIMRGIDFEEDDDCFSKAADRFEDFVKALAGEAMEYFPVDAYFRDLWRVLDMDN